MSILILFAFLTLFGDTAITTADTTAAEYKLVWADEFMNEGRPDSASCR